MNKLHARRYYDLQIVNALFREEKFGRNLPEEKLLFQNIIRKLHLNMMLLRVY
jgi:hypothetical protein